MKKEIEEKIKELIESQLRVSKEMNYGIGNTATMILAELDRKGFLINQ